MTNFDELIGAEPAGAERERLRHVHELLLEVGPPPEISPELESGPTLGMTFGRARRMARRPRRYIPALVAAVLLTVFVAISLSSQGGNTAVALRGTGQFSQATGALVVLTPNAGKQPMQISVRNLMAGHYVVYLIRGNQPWERCGTFTVTNPNTNTIAMLSSPYLAKPHDSWVVTTPGQNGRHGATVLQPVA